MPLSSPARATGVSSVPGCGGPTAPDYAGCAPGRRHARALEVPQPEDCLVLPLRGAAAPRSPVLLDQSEGYRPKVALMYQAYGVLYHLSLWERGS